MHRTLIFTPLFSSGRAWLINILLELNIRVEQPGKGITWEDNEFGSRMIPDEFERNNQILPAIRRRKYIRFRENIK